MTVGITKGMITEAMTGDTTGTTGAIEEAAAAAVVIVVDTTIEIVIIDLVSATTATVAEVAVGIVAAAEATGTTIEAMIADDRVADLVRQGEIIATLATASVTTTGAVTDPLLHLTYAILPFPKPQRPRSRIPQHRAPREQWIFFTSR